ncbi:MAG: hypothetical protein V2A73_08050, partial [Pseudomonadota bacterium]
STLPAAISTVTAISQTRRNEAAPGSRAPNELALFGNPSVHVTVAQCSSCREEGIMPRTTNRRIGGCPLDLRGDDSLDKTICRRLPLHDLKKRIRVAVKNLEAALGTDREPWLQAEALLNDFRIRREDAYFVLGYEHGLAAASAELLRARLHDSEVDQSRIASLAHEIRKRTIQTDLPDMLKLAALLESVWAMAMVMVEKRLPTTPGGGQRWR